LPLFSVPRLRSCIAFSTLSCAFLPYLAILTPLSVVLFKQAEYLGRTQWSKLSTIASVKDCESRAYGDDTKCS
jgi:hypothetical protein